MTERYAIYYAPAADDPLWARAAEWIGRDPLTGTGYDGPVAGIARERLMPLTASARRYGFHATLKPPMALAEGTSPAQLTEAVGSFAAEAYPVEIGPIGLASIDGFLALVPQLQHLAVTGFAGRVVEAFERFRAPLSEAEIARRMAGGSLTPRQIDLLDFYGYPYVLDQFQFHMTLTDRLAPADRAEIEPAARGWFEDWDGHELTLDRLVLFHQPEADAPFARGAEFLLGGR